MMNFLAFVHNANLRYKCFFAEKREDMDEKALLAALHAAIDPFVDSNFAKLSSYGQITVAYDKGQKQISTLITETLERRFNNVRVTKTLPVQSRLTQVADFACTIKRIEHKLSLFGGLAKCEEVFFGGLKNFKQFWLKSLRKCEWR